MNKSGKRCFAVCIRNDGYPASLEPHKIYQVVADAHADRHKLIRVIDESGEDFLYPADFFIALELPPAVQEALGRRTGA